MFATFSPSHIGVLICGALLTAAGVSAARKSPKILTHMTRAVGVACLLSVPFSQWAWRSSGVAMSIENRLPLQLCDLSVIIAGLALLTQRETLRQIGYFWGLAAAPQALLTPALTYDFPHPTFIAFFVHHWLMIAAALHILVVQQWRPRVHPLKAALRAYLFALLYVSLAMVINRVLGSNFGFLAHPPPNPSLLDLLGPWPWYILAMQAIALGCFALLAWPLSKKSSHF